MVDRIHSFLKLDLKHAQAASITPTSDSPQKASPLFAAEGAQSSQASDDAASATSSEESFELVGTADVAESDAAKTPLAEPSSDGADAESGTLNPAAGDVMTSSSDDVSCQ